MTVEPGPKPDVNPRKDVGALRAGQAVDVDAGDTSPFRFLLVIVPLLVIVMVGSNLLGLWSTSFWQAARPPQVEIRPSVEKGFGKPLPKAPSAPSENTPVGSDSNFDAAIVLALLPKANPDDGASVFRMCRACHDSERNAPFRIGTSLWGIVNQRKAAHPGFNYSAALKAKGGTWSYRDLADYLNNPRKFAPGTSMAFAGIASNRRMADLLAYLRTLSDSPAPLPN